MSAFRTIEIANPRFTHEGLSFVTIKSPALGGRADLTLFVPGATNGLADVPCVILLHGIYGSHWSWAFQGGAHRTARQLIHEGRIPPMVLVMPSDGLWGDGSGYVRHATQDFERWIVDEVPIAAAEAVACLSARSPLFIGGLSMGGFGALRIAAKYPKRFRAASGHSSITHLGQLDAHIEGGLTGYKVQDQDLSLLTTMLRHKEDLPPFRFDCGTEDTLIEVNRELHQQLAAHGIPHHYDEFPGGHDWPYWESHLEKSLLFFGALSNQRDQRVSPPTGVPARPMEN